MGVRKFRSIEEMPGSPPLPPLLAANLETAFGLMEFTSKLSNRMGQPGIRKYRSIFEASRARDTRDKLFGSDAHDRPV